MSLRNPVKQKLLPSQAVFLLHLDFIAKET